MVANDFAELSPRIRAGLSRLTGVCQSDEFVALAMQRRSSRAIRDLKSADISAKSGQISVDSYMRQAKLGICHLMAGADKLDFSYPGGHIYIHRGAEDGVRFITDTQQFRVGDVPGVIGDDVRLALVEKFLECGFLELIRE